MTVFKRPSSVDCGFFCYQESAFFVFLSMVALEFRQEQNSILIEIFKRQKYVALVKDLLALWSLNKVLVFTITGQCLY